MGNESLLSLMGADPLVEKLAKVTHHKQSKKKAIPSHVKQAWETLDANFVTRHKALKQTPLKLCYSIVRDWMEGQK